MKCWAVTGPTGAGKSLLTSLFAERGAQVIDADRVGHEILARDEIITGICEHFGSNCIVSGRVDRPALGRLVFGAPEAMTRLNAIMHPPLAAELAAQLAAVAAAGVVRLAVLEAAVYFLLPLPGPMDLTIVVLAPVAVRRARLMTGHGLSEAEADRRIAAQDYLEPLWARADEIVENTDGIAQLRRTADDLLNRHL